jgi:elongation factor G
MSNLTQPLIEIAIEPKYTADVTKLGLALEQLVAEDAAFTFSVDRESGQTVIKGMDEPQLEVAVDRIKREFKVEVNVGAPQVAYRETITCPADIDYTYKKQTGGSGQFARVKMHFEPSPPGSGFTFEIKVISGTVPKEYIPGVEKGVKGSLDSGVIAGFPVVDFKVELTDGAYHEIDSSALAFEIAARATMREGFSKASAGAA